MGVIGGRGQTFSLNTGAKYFHSSYIAAGSLYGWHSMIARNALS
jgi:hypothetical protein